MYMIRRLAGVEARKKIREPRPSGIAMSEEGAADVVEVEIWGSSYNDPGDDFCEFRVRRADGSESCVRVDGY